MEDIIKIGIVEDNTVLRKSLVTLFNGTAGMQCVMAENNLQHILEELRSKQPGIVLMDIGLPGISGIEGVRLVKHNFPLIHILMFTVFEDDDKIFDAIRSGASGYLLKKATPQEIIDAVHELHQGGAPMSASIARRVIQSFQTPAFHLVKDAQLTPTEMAILHSLVDGLSYRKIAEKHFISISTVQTHICNIYHVHSKAQAVAKALGKR
jgi:DNA-binding NarL/FixJ family response regulator